MIVRVTMDKADLDTLIVAEELLRSQASVTPGSAKFLTERAQALALVRRRLTVGLKLAQESIQQRQAARKGATAA